MNFFRIIFIFIVLFSATECRATPSGRKIAPIAEAGFIDSSNMSTSPDGQFLVMLSAPGEKGSDCLVFNRRTHETTTIPGSSRMEPLCFSHDSRHLWIWGLHLDEPLPGLRLKPADRPFVALYDLRRKRYVRALSGLQEDWEVPGTSCDDGRTLLFISQGGIVSRFDIRTGHLLGSHPRYRKNGNATSAEFSADGKKFLSIKANEDQEVQNVEVRSTSNNKVLSKLRLSLVSGNGAYNISNVLIAPQGMQVAALQSETQKWVFMDARGSHKQWELGGPTAANWKWSPDARHIAITSSKGFELRDARSGRLITSAKIHGDTPITFSPDGSIIYALKEGDIGFGPETTLWQWRLFPTRKQRRSDVRYMRKLRRSEERFALSPKHLNESLIQAARRGDPQRAAMLLNRGANIETLDSHGDSPMMSALAHNDVYGGPGHYDETAKLLITRGANVTKHGGDLLAASAGHEELMTILLAHGARVNDSAAHYGTPTALHAAVGFNELKSVQILLQHGANTNATDETGKTLLMELIAHIDPGFPLPKQVIPIIRLLIQHGADINARNQGGQTALAMCQNSTVKTFLRKAGAKA